MNGTEAEGVALMNKLAREQFKYKILKEVAFDLQVCEIEGWNKREYINELKAVVGGL